MGNYEKRGKILALAHGAVVGAVVLSRCGHKNTAVEYESRPTVRVENPVRQDISLYTDLTGLVEPESAGGVIPNERRGAGVYFQAGDTVRGRAGAVRNRFNALTTLKLQVDAASCLKNADKQF